MLYPVNLNIINRRCLIIGGGEVASRKVDSLLLCGGVVQVVSPQVSTKISLLAEEGVVQWKKREYEDGDLNGAFLVIAATNKRELQERIALDAQEKDVLFNSADNPGSCTFQVPATVRRGDFLVAISTGGGSPAFSSQIRKKVEAEYGPEYGVFVDLLSKIREQVIKDGGSQQSHKNIFEKLLQSNILDCIKEENWLAVNRELEKVLPKSVSCRTIIEVAGPSE